MKPNLIITASDLNKSFDDFHAVKGIDFTIERGECFGFLGPNGAGKTTTMKMIYRGSPVGSGSLTVNGMDATDGKLDRKIKKSIGVVPQLDNLDTELTVEENLDVFCRFYKLRGKELKQKVDELLEFADLTERRKAKVLALSGGMRRRLLVARGMIGEPDIVVLDEPTTGLDPVAREKLWSKLAALKDRGCTLLLTTHYMREAERLCDRLAIMDEGKIVAVGTPKELIEQNVPPFVVEIIGTKEILAGREAPLLKLSKSSQSLRDRLILYCDEPDEIMSRATTDLPDRTTLARPSTLEDVFLSITGKGLQ